MPYSKYHNHKITIGGETFDSKAEANRWYELRMLERAGEIYGLKRQVPFELIPAMYDDDRKLIERACKYIADFCYTTRDGVYVVEDVKSKGTITKEFRIKRKLMLYIHNIRIREVQVR